MARSDFAFNLSRVALSNFYEIFYARHSQNFGPGTKGTPWTPLSTALYVEGNGSSVLIAMPLSYRYSAFILIQKLARKFDSKEFCKPSSADSSNNLTDSKNMLNSQQSSDVEKSECGRSIELLTFLLVTGRSRYSQARGHSTNTQTDDHLASNVAILC